VHRKYKRNNGDMPQEKTPNMRMRLLQARYAVEFEITMFQVCFSPKSATDNFVVDGQNDREISSKEKTVG
jgi:hypothetical protein